MLNGKQCEQHPNNRCLRHDNPLNRLDQETKNDIPIESARIGICRSPVFITQQLVHLKFEMLHGLVHKVLLQVSISVSLLIRLWIGLMVIERNCKTGKW